MDASQKLQRRRMRAVHVGVVLAATEIGLVAILIALCLILSPESVLYLYGYELVPTALALFVGVHLPVIALAVYTIRVNPRLRSSRTIWYGCILLWAPIAALAYWNWHAHEIAAAA